MSSFAGAVIAWQRLHGRHDLPWQNTRDPYPIWLSEIMLQQTQVDRVLPKYAEWLSKYPTMDALATAPEQDVTRTWYPLGYNIRPKRLQSIARESVSKYGGRLPADEATLLSFKGIGAYTAGAISEETVRMTDEYIAAADPPAAMRRLLLEGRDDVLRALRCQAKDRQA